MANLLADVCVSCNKRYATTRFYEKGVELQNEATSWWDAKKQYQHSCMLCCMSNRPGVTDCASCPIRAAMLNNADFYWRRMPKQEYAWVEQERRLE